MSLYTPVIRWCFPENALADSIAAMARDGRQGNEGLVLWLGCITGEAATITHLVTLPDRWITKRPNVLHVAPAALSALVDFAEPLDVSLVGQIHSHPGTFVDLSPADRQYGINAPYYLSVVAPHYAQRPGTTWGECGVHEFLPSTGFRRLQPGEAYERIRILPKCHAPCIILGEQQ